MSLSLFQSLDGLIVTYRRDRNEDKDRFQSLDGLIVTAMRTIPIPTRIIFQSLDGLIVTIIIENKLPDDATFQSLDGLIVTILCSSKHRRVTIFQSLDGLIVTRRRRLACVTPLPLSIPRRSDCNVRSTFAAATEVKSFNPSTV